MIIILIQLESIEYKNSLKIQTVFIEESPVVFIMCDVCVIVARGEMSYIMHAFLASCSSW